MAEKETILKEQPILERINAVRTKLLKGASDDHLEVVAGWERKAKKSLIALSLQGHEGIEMLREQAKLEIRQINRKLLEDSGDLQFKDPELYAARNYQLIVQRRTWLWFINFFVDAKTDLRDVEAELDLEEEAADMPPGE